MGDDVEIEEVELGDDERDLAADVDDGIPEEDEYDPEGLDSDDEDDDTKIPGLDLEEDTDGQSTPALRFLGFDYRTGWLMRSSGCHHRTVVHSPTLLSLADREADEGL